MHAENTKKTQDVAELGMTEENTKIQCTGGPNKTMNEENTKEQCTEGSK